MPRSRTDGAARHRSSAVPLAWLMAALTVYASLYPFSGWRVPGVSVFAFVIAPWWPWWTPFDLITNFLGYMPFGAVLFGALVRSGWPTARAVVTACLLATLLSFSMETLQNFLPQWVASNVDLALNSLGAAVGVALGALLHLRGFVDHWQKARDRWFVARSAGGMALLVSWPLGLLFPTAVPFGLGHVLGRVREALVAWLQDTQAQGWVSGWAEVPADRSALAPATELAVIVLGLMAPCLIAFTISMPGWRRVVLVLVGAALGGLTTTLSTALNFGPSHAFAWVTAQTLQAIAIGIGAASLLSLLPRRAAAGFGLIALTALVMLVAQTPADPYFAQSLRAWEQGRFIRFHGAAQWIGWLWPYAALTYLLARVAARDTAQDIASDSSRAVGRGPVSTSSGLDGGF